MLDAKFVRENLSAFRKSLKKRYINIDLEKILELDEKRAKLQRDLDQKRAERNRIAKQFAQSPEAKKQLTAKGKKVKEEIDKLEKEFSKITQELENLLLQVPNLVASDVPEGRTEEENVEIKKWGKLPKFNFKPKDHVELGEKLDIIDFAAGAQVAGSRFYYLKNQAALLELALINFAFEILTKKGFVPVITPELVKERITTGTGFRPRSELEEQIYKIEGHDLYLVATAEVPLLGLHADSIFAETELPKKYLGFSTSFRTEAGSWGKDVRGILRTHQFDKVEMFVFCAPRDSEKIHQQLLSDEEEIYRSLEIPYRVVNVCAGDLGSPAYKKYDIEAWIPSQGRFREITSCSNTTDYQARRLNIKYKETRDARLETRYVHTLNATAIAIGRTLIAILENYQQKDGQIYVPKVLQKYTGFSKIPPKSK